MSLFGQQLQKRLENDKAALDNNERHLGAVLSVKKSSSDTAKKSDGSPDNVKTSDGDVSWQLELIARYLKLERTGATIASQDMTDDQIVEDFLRSTNMHTRSVRLVGDWWKDGDGPMLATLRDGGVRVALFPRMAYGMYYHDPVTDKRVNVTSKNAGLFEEGALYLYCPLPARPLTGKEYLSFFIHKIRPGDIILYAVAFLFASYAGNVSTVAVKIAFDRIIPAGATSLLLSLFLFLVAVAFANFLMRSALFTLSSRMQHRLATLVENSLIARVVNLPVAFFGDKTAGGLSQRIAAASQVSSTIATCLLVISNVVISFIMFLPVVYVAPELVPAGLTAIVLTLLVYAVTLFQERQLAMRRLSSAERNGGVVYDLFSGAQRLKLSGSEDRADAKWLGGYAEQAKAAYSTRFPLCVRAQLVEICRLVGLLIAFYLAYEGHVSVSSFAAFSTAFGMAMGCLDTASEHLKWIAELGPNLKMGEPILQAVPEYGTDNAMASELSGRIELSHVTFRYDEDGPAILDDLSLNIKPGEYVGIVGSSGCGKSTLVKILLGFQTPQQGSVYYDDFNMATTNLRSLRRCIGTVLQDGKLFAGDIYSNITITAPSLSVEAAWEAAEKVGMADDIRRMPMGMRTRISEGSGGISGGQKQRLMIARAIVGKPRILIMDEATSALDNITQKTVTESLDSLDCTRIVIAHRLSTIRSCDRIIALDKGHIVESGSYDELMEKDGFFAELVRRQQIEEAA